MLKIRHLLIVLGMLLCSAASAGIQVSIGINVPVYPQLVVVPGYPVYYAPRLRVNLFFYDGMYWVYQDDYWYMSSWYNGPWWLVEPEFVPVFVLRVPVRYYRSPPVYFLEWRQDAPPHWGEHWGRDWEQRRSGWDRWNRSATPAPAPLPVYQREYSGDRYPRQVEQQQELHQQKYRYQPRDAVVRQQYQEQAVQQAPAQQQKPGVREERGARQQDMQRSMPRRQEGPAAPRSPSQQRGGEEVQDLTPAIPQQGRREVQDPRQQPQPEAARREQPMPRAQGREERLQGKDATRKPKRGQGPEEERGRDRNE